VKHVWRSCVIVIAAVLALACAVPIAAHEIGTTRVFALVEDGRFAIEVVTDAASLAEKLEAAAGPRRPGGPSAPTAAAGIRDRLAALDDVFRERVTVTFDESTVHPSITYSVSPAVDDTSPIVGMIRLTGEVPYDARQFSWSYSWTFASYALTFKSHRSDDPITVWLEGGQTSMPQLLAAPTAPVSRIETAWRYLALGFTHIVPHGLDHMLFVIGIFLLSGRLRTVLWQVSAFTVAHSITLGLSIYGVIAAPPAIVEPLIAVSIVYVAIENILVRELKPWRIALVFAFGLLHGMGFAGALKELGLPRSEFLTALVTFNLGVETGQLAVIGAAFLLVGWQCRNRAWYRGRIIIPASVAIACIAAYWTVERIAGRLIL
jgi:hydrogenase/urease accessory protein HupE